MSATSRVASAGSNFLRILMNSRRLRPSTNFITRKCGVLLADHFHDRHDIRVLERGAHLAFAMERSACSGSSKCLARNTFSATISPVDLWQAR